MFLEPKQPRIVNVLKAIRALPRGPEPTGDGQDVFDVEDSFYWRELSYWAGDWWDDFNGK